VPPVIRLAGVSKSYRRRSERCPTTLKSYLLRDLWRRRRPTPEVTWALRDVSLTVNRGTTVAIIGRNGSGKSTLLKLVGGLMRPTSGTISVDGRASALIELGAGFHPELTGRENVLVNGVILGLSKAEVAARFDDIVEFAELREFIDEPVRTYSTGMYMRLGFAVAVHATPEILLVDEVLAVGDLQFVQKCFERMDRFRKDGNTILVVTHDLEMARTWCDEAIWIDEGRVRRAGASAPVVDAYWNEVAGAAAPVAGSGPARPPGVRHARG
jgi:lipopolysaccharide transport system ATP-binding protein